VLGRNFWFCTIDDPSMAPLLGRIGLDHVMIESDYPHADSTWPDTQEVVHAVFGHLDPDQRRLVAAGNAATLFRHPMPAQDDWRQSAAAG
jgi:predicted TIM-barrel fold metal-dependent hydrolase